MFPRFHLCGSWVFGRSAQRLHIDFIFYYIVSIRYASIESTQTLKCPGTNARYLPMRLVFIRHEWFSPHRMQWHLLVRWTPENRIQSMSFAQSLILAHSRILGAEVCSILIFTIEIWPQTDYSAWIILRIRSTDAPTTQSSDSERPIFGLMTMAVGASARP